MTLQYTPLNHAKQQIRVLTIHPVRRSHAQTSPVAGRTRNPWQSHYHDLDAERESRVQNASAVRIFPDEELIRCSLDVVSLDDVSDAYDAFRGNGNDPKVWPAYIAASPSSVGTGNRSQEGSSSWKRWMKRLGRKTRSNEQHTGPETYELPSWRTVKWNSDDDIDVRVASLTQAETFSPRYKWGDFEALSYTWGDEKQLASIELNGKVVQIGRNAEAALRRLRALPETVLGMKYWIDAICVNQDDKEECSREVKRMGWLYNAARSVVVWLGDEADDSNEACDLLCNLSYMVQPTIWRARPTTFHKEITAKSLLCLLRRPYWHRAWIIQELAMNRSDTTFLCGDRAFFRQELSVLLQFISEYTNTRVDVEQAQGGDGMDADTIAPRLWTLAEHISALLAIDASGGDEITLEQVLDLSQKAHCKDPRDKIYGMFNLLPQALASLIEPDYDAGVDDVLQDFSRKLAGLKGLEFLLSWAGTPKSGTLASWCIDMGSTFPRNHVQWLRGRKANGDRTFAHHFEEGKKLICEGVQVDVIGNLALGVLRPSDLNLWPAEAHFTSDLSNDAPVVSDAVLSNALVETLLLQHPMKSDIDRSILNVPWSYKPQVEEDQDTAQDFEASHGEDIANWTRFWEHIAPSGFLAPFDKFRRANADFEIAHGHTLRDFFPALWPTIQIPKPPSPVMFTMDIDGIPQQVAFSGFMAPPRTQISGKIAWDMQLAAVSLVNRRLTTTGAGRLALVPDDACVGDVIAVLGCPFPVVLRPVGEEYRYVGECFVHGIMDGEAVSQDSVSAAEFVVI